MRLRKRTPDVFNILLQVLDDGHITDAQGRKVDFKETIIIMTSNAGAQSIVEPKKLGFGAADSASADYKKMKDSVMGGSKASVPSGISEPNRRYYCLPYAE